MSRPVGIQLTTRGEPGRAAVLEETNGVRKEIGFIGADGRRIFSVTHHPAGQPVGGVLICSPFQSEFLANHRREVRLAELLVAEGFVVERFHYVGTGHSDGRSDDVTLASMIADALVAEGRLRDAPGVDRIAVVGTRLASLVAARVAESLPSVPLVLWEPAVDGATYFAEILRLRKMQELKDNADPAHRVEPLEALKRDGALDVLGCTIGISLYESAQTGTSLTDLEGVQEILLVQIDVDGRIRRPCAQLVEKWSERGLMAEIAVVRGRETWWFPGLRWHDGSMNEADTAVIERTSEWLKRSFQISLPTA
jgi:hypothetical protein